MSTAGVLAAGATLAALAVANSSPEVRWTMTSAFQPSLDLVFNGARTCAAEVSEATDGRFAIGVEPVDTIASAIDAVNAVADGKADCAHTSLSYSWTTHPAYFVGSGVPFGVNARQHSAWLRTGSGSELINGLLAERGLMAVPMGSAGGQMAGWFRKEMHNADELAGMKVRIGGICRQGLAGVRGDRGQFTRGQDP